MTGKLLPLTLWQMPGKNISSDFTLPGMEELMSFSTLWESEKPADSPASTQASRELPESRPFSTPGLLPKDVAGEVTLTCALPVFVSGEHVTLTVPPLMGQGALSVNDKTCLTFCSFPESGAPEPMSCQKELDLTTLLEPDRHNTLNLHFESSRPAGICDLFVIRTVTGGRIQLTQATRNRSEISCTCLATIYTPGTYRLSITDLNCPGPLPEESFSLSQPGSRSFSFTLPLRRNEVLYYRFALMEGDDILDAFTIPAGSGPRRCDIVLPVPAGDAVLYPPDLVRLLEMIGKPALYSVQPLSRGCVEALMKAGIPLILPPDAPGTPPEYAVHPNIRFDPFPPVLSSGAASVWQLCGLLLSPRPVPPGQPVSNLLEEVFGRKALERATGLPAHLARLHLLHVRLHAELVRQGLGSGALCAPAEWDDSAVLAILANVFRPGHLSISPLRCACFTSSDLIVSVRVYLPEDCPPDGEVTLSFTCPSDADSAQQTPLSTQTLPVSALVSENRLIHLSLPDKPCICSLSGRLTLSGTVTDTVSVPIFVGLDAPLEQVLLHPETATAAIESGA